MEKISCIIPAYNEGRRIGQVLAIVNGHRLIDEVIVIDDGSSDNTREVVSAYPGVRLIIHEANQGKSRAVVDGITHARNNLLMFLDADLVGLTPENITALAEPVLWGDADVTISLRKNTLLVYKLLGLDFVSGERVFPKKLISGHLHDISKLPGYGLEVYMNKLIIAEKYRMKVVKWSNVVALRKAGKIGFWKGRWADVGMIREILKVASLWEILRQNYILFPYNTRKTN